MLAVGKKPEATEEEMPMEEAMMEEETPRTSSITLPKGFRLPEGAKEGEPFTTTIRGVARNGQLEIQALGDMPMHSETKETPEEEESESSMEEEMEPTEGPQPEVLAAETERYKRKKADEMAAKKAFQG